MAKAPDKLYEFHVSNLRSVTAGLGQIARSTRNAVSRGDDVSDGVLKRLYALLLGAWAECRLAKLLYEPNAFTVAERELVQMASTHLDRWHKIVEVAFRKHFFVPKAALKPPALPHSAHARLEALSDTLNTDLRFIVTLRNKLAHGQWVYPLNDSGDDVAQNQMDALRTENILSLQFKHTILDNLLNTVHDLAKSLPTFERDFDYHFAGVERARLNLKTREYSSYVQMMRAKYERGQAKRRAMSTI